MSDESQKKKPDSSSKEDELNKLYEKLGVDLISLQVGNNLLNIADPEVNPIFLQKIKVLRHKIVEELGYIMPQVRVMDSNILSINSYQINIRGIPMEIKELPEDKVAISSQHYELYKHLLQGTKPIKHGHQYYYWVTFKKKSINPEHITVHEDLIIQNIKDIVIQEIHKLLDYYHILKLIELVRQHNKHLIADTIDFRISTIYIQRIMANLLREEVSMKDVMYFFERLNYYCQTERNPDVISEKIRMDYSDTICHHWRDDDNQIHAIKVSDPWQCILINPKESESLLKKVEEKLDRHGLFDGRRPILICQPKLRQTLFLALCKHIPNIVVLSETEINVSTKLIITDEI